MKIVKQGKLPDKLEKLYTGACKNCHCEVEEIEFTELHFNSDSMPFIVCPTLNCYERIYCWGYNKQTVNNMFDGIKGNSYCIICGNLFQKEKIQGLTDRCEYCQLL